jgi:hypothetical protein
MLGIIIGVTATRINAPLAWWRAHLSVGVRRWLGKLWPWLFVGSLIAWLCLLLGTILLDYFFGVSNPILLVSALFFVALGTLLLAILTGFAHDSLQPEMGREP